MPTADREQLVVVSSPFFPHKLSKGYGGAYSSVVQSVNGTPVHSLKHLVTLLRDMKEEYVVLRFDQRAGEALVFPRKEVDAATEEILNDNGVRSQGSADVMAIWKKN
jgi:hypothetical protein